MNKQTQLANDISVLLSNLSNMASKGINLLYLEACAVEWLKENDLVGCNKGYKQVGTIEPFNSVLSLSVNETIAHGEPFDYVLKDGDLLNIDTSITDGTVCADAAISVGIGDVSNKYKRLMRYAKATTMHAIQNMRVGMNTYDLAREIEKFAGLNGYNIIRRFSGHKIGSKVHEKPAIYNTTETTHEYEELTEGIYCIEPILTLSKDTIGLPDQRGWNVQCLDHEYAAYFEHMVLLTKDTKKILTSHF
jgi:methionyl aminopeptidase